MLQMGELCEVPALKGTEVSLSYAQCFSCLAYVFTYSWILSGQTLYLMSSFVVYEFVIFYGVPNAFTQTFLTITQ